jgi:hypothetical protein
MIKINPTENSGSVNKIAEVIWVIKIVLINIEPQRFNGDSHR